MEAFIMLEHKEKQESVTPRLTDILAMLTKLSNQNNSTPAPRFLEKFNFSQINKGKEIYWGICRDGERGLVALFGEPMPYGRHGPYLYPESLSLHNQHERAQAYAYDALILHVQSLKKYRPNSKYLGEYERAMIDLRAAVLDVATGKKSLSDYPDFRTKDTEAREMAIGWLSGASHKDTFTAQRGNPGRASKVFNTEVQTGLFGFGGKKTIQQIGILTPTGLKEQPFVYEII
jgi:hypothetical protein